MVWMDVRAAAATFALGVGAWTVAVPAVAFADIKDSAGTSASPTDSGSSPVRAGLAPRGAPEPTINPADPVLPGVVPDAGRGARVGVAGRVRSAASTMSAVDISRQSSPAVGSTFTVSPSVSRAAQDSPPASAASPDASAPLTLRAASVSSPVTGTEQAAAVASVPTPSAVVVPAGIAPVASSAVVTSAAAKPRPTAASSGSFGSAESPMGPIRTTLIRLLDSLTNRLLEFNNPITDFLAGGVWLVRKRPGRTCDSQGWVPRT